MENSSYEHSNEDEAATEFLPPGFRFHPTDEELITHYLSKKVRDSSFTARAIGEVDLNKAEPWDFPRKDKMREKESYFFCFRDRKYPTGLRTNRATKAGYWKATGKDKDIYRDKTLIGMKKTLVFYTGRAPKGQKSNWVIHEYRLEGNYSKHNLPNTAQNDWVISRVFEKSPGGRKKTNISAPAKRGSHAADGRRPPLFRPSKESCETKIPIATTSSTVDSNYNPLASALAGSPSSSQFSNFSSKQDKDRRLLYTDLSVIMQQDQSLLRLLMEGHGCNVKTTSSKAELSQDTGLSGDMNTDMSSAVSCNEMLQRPLEDQQFPSNLDARTDLDFLLNYW
ncbi:hypothetical protein Nepgr_028835 [Nepenthes gracilis]|uniref:NAC domain-containing protein n=1 Tax=Nepenthes gracilis TaxID=150966 RepID=A0AAD3TCT4_NEPGR|nr:hypothetical protein Nepgr_028835 [Nepenthes gracilis]